MEDWMILTQNCSTITSCMCLFIAELRLVRLVGKGSSHDIQEHETVHARHCLIVVAARKRVNLMFAELVKPLDGSSVVTDPALMDSVFGNRPPARYGHVRG
jgi:hypothetical protein